MDIKTLEKAQELLKEIKELKEHTKYKQNTKHLEIRPHYGDTSIYDRICIPTRFNNRIFKVIDEIINEMETELEKM